ncbi:RNA-directed DNA polymerase, eukaryota, reverse transcriptase zinc-binding domain protein [Tanacetum coccineum]
MKEMKAKEDSEVRTLKIRMLKEKEYQSKNVEDEFDNEDGIAQTMTGDNVIGLMLKEKEYQSKNVEDEFDNEDGIAQTMTGSKRKELWRDIMRAKMIKSGWPWLMTSDFNVTLKNEEHSNGGSRISNDMQDFIDCVNEAEMKDLCSNGFPDANALFLPYLVSDHSPVVVRFPSSYEKKKKAFRFANFIAEKVDFLLTVATNWEVEVQGYKMYQLVKKMKALKYNLNAVSWKNGNLSENVEKYRNELKIAQTNLDNHPHNQDTKEKEVNALKEYNEASNDEESFLFRKAKVGRKIWEDLKENMENRDLSNSWDILVDQNARLFTGEVKDDRIMLKIVVENVKLQLSSLKVDKSCNVEKVASKWNVR